MLRLKDVDFFPVTCGQAVADPVLTWHGGHIMTFHYDEQSYPGAELTAYRAADCNVLAVATHSGEHFVFIITAISVRRAEAKEIRDLANRQGMSDLRKAVPLEAASAA